MTWETVPFSRAFSDVTANSPRIKQSEVAKSGRYPVRDQGEQDIAGYWDEDSATTKVDRPLILFGDHTRRVKYADTDFVIGADGVKVLLPSAELDPRFAFHWMRSLEIPSAGYSRHFKFLRDRTVPLPPLPEQRRIAAILDEADALRAKARSAFETADTAKRCLFGSLEMSGLERVRLGDLGTWASGGTPLRTKSEYFGGAIAWVTSGELGELYIEDTAEHLTNVGLANSSAKLVPRGALMLGMYDTAALKSSIAATDLTCNQAVAFGVLKDTVVPEYVYFAVQAQKARVRALQRGIRQKNLNLSMIRDIEVSLPTHAVQSKFAEDLAALTAHQRNLANRVDAADSLFASLHQRAFRGEL